MFAEFVDATRRLLGVGGEKKKTLPRAVDPVIADVVRSEPIRDLVELVDDMVKDPMVVITMSVFLSKLKTTDFTVSLDAPEGDARAEAITEDIRRLIDETLEKLCDFHNGLLTWGGLPFEIVIDNTTVDGTPISRIKQFKQLPKHVDGQRATEYVLNPDGTFGGIRVTIGGSDFVIQAEQAAWFAIGATPLAPHGRSLFLGAPAEVRKRRKKTDGLIDIFAGRWAIDGPVIHAPATAVDENNNIVDNHQRIAEQYAASKTAGGLTILSNEAHGGLGMDGKYQIDITHESRAMDCKPLEILDNLIDAKMSRAFGVHESVTMDTETGSYASQTVRMFVVLSKCDSFAWAVADCLQRQCERVYLHANYGDGSAPTLKIVPVSHITDSFLVETVKAVLAMPQWGPLLESGAIDLATILSNAGVPLAGDYRERIDEAFAQVQAARQQFEEEPEEQDPFALANEAHYLAVKKKSDALDSLRDVMRWGDPTRE